MHLFALKFLRASIAIFLLSFLYFCFFGGVVFAYNALPTQTTFYLNDDVSLVLDCDDGNNLTDVYVFIYDIAGQEIQGLNCGNDNALYLSLGTTQDLINNGFSAGEVTTYFSYSVCSDIIYCSSNNIYGGIFFDLSDQLPPQQSTNIFGVGGLLGTSTNLLANVSTGVTQTGVAIWPLFTVLGVLLAFVIAGKVRDLIMEMGADQRNKEKYHSDLANAKNQQKIFDVIDKKDRGGYN